MCAFYLAFCTSKKQAVRPDGTGHSLPPAAHISKRQGTAQLHKKNPSAGRIPRQAGRPGPIGHCVVGFCGTARVEWAGPVWAKNRSGRALTCASFPPSQRRAPFRGIHKGGGAHVVLESRPKQRPSLLGLSARSALARDARARCASRARGQRPLPVCPSPAGLVHRSVRAQCRGVLRCGPGRVGGACLDKKQVEAGCDMRVPSTQPKAGTLPGVP